MTIPFVDPPDRRDQHLAAKTMGSGRTVVLPRPMIGSFTRKPVRAAELSFDLLPDSSPVSVIELVHHLQLTEELISWKDMPGSPVAEILLAEGFFPLSVTAADGTLETHLVWRSLA